ncbi:hypothetical protein BH11BAC4_BH11BAC4_09940 [soil metagenome]
MKQFGIFLFLLALMVPGKLAAQQITYSEFNGEDNRDMNFEILGKMNDTYIIYKNIRWKHVLAFYDKDMKIQKSVRLTFVPDKTFNIDFITYADHFYMVYQYQRNNVIHCMGVKMGADGKKLSEPVQMDTTKLGILAENKIYNTVYSQDKQKIMVYKMQQKNQQFTVVAKLFDNNLTMIDSTRMVSPYDEKSDAYSDLYVTNEGNFMFAKIVLTNYRKKISGLDIITRKPGTNEYITKPISFENKYFDEIKIKVDNLNNHYIINSLYYDKQGGNVAGLFTAVLNINDIEVKKFAFNPFPNEMRSRISDGLYKSAFDNLVIQQAIVKKDGGFVLMAEDNYSQERSGPSNSSWDRYNYLYNSPYSTNTDYYYSNPSYNGFYRPLNSFNGAQNTRYYYDNILVLSLDSSMAIQWSNILPKKQTDDDSDNYLSYALMNVGSEIHFIYVEEDRNKQIISNQSVFPDGQIKRYPTLKSREAGFEFMPRKAKQVGFRELIIPCVYRANIAFAKVDFFE